MDESQDKAIQSAEKTSVKLPSSKDDSSKALASEKPKETAPAAAKAEPAKSSAPAASSAPKVSEPAKATPVQKKTAVKAAVKKPAARSTGKAKANPAEGTKTEKAAPVAAKVSQSETTPKATISELKEQIMATAKTNEFTGTMDTAMKDIQARASAAYEKSQEMMGEMTEFTKGNVEAMVEAGKILSSGMQEMSKAYVEDAKSAYEAATTDMKAMAAVKSPTELFQLQSNLMRRHFDSMVAFGSKSSDDMVKLANDAIAPLSGRMTVATEKFSKVA
ncbi:phasin family protein [Altererythrobacter indicus]|uniref:Phasin family protein n=1 Tax=Altericroceibacterium indicum TaxID=374177 RepID=A0A845A9M0_9SPHN|nr:phasin family protein [Altericroceibacterium indicum]MXP25953.1 phasin family protein [Altericroceibacterium indicum]